MQEWTASIAYDARNTLRLAKTLHNTFHFKQKLFLLLASAAVIVAGISVGLRTPAGLLMTALGCILLMNTDAAVRGRARALTRQLGGYVPVMRYTFGEEAFRGETKNERNEFSYEGIIRLLDDGAFLYLFPSRDKAFMVDKATVQPAGCAALKAHIAQKTGVAWTKPGNLLNRGLLTLISNYKNTKKAA